MTPLHQQALALARAGYKVFPCLPDSKVPRFLGGFHGATADLGWIDAHWTAHPTDNVAFCPEDMGLAVIDLDPGGAESWVALLAENGQHEPTYEVETPRGGRHLVFAGSLPSTVGQLGVHVDTRGAGGYVLVPPSIVNGKPYRVLNDREIAPLPDWIGHRLTAGRQRVRAAHAELDTPSSLQRARGLVASAIRRGRVAIEGCGGDNLTYQLAAELLNLGVSVETAHRLLLEEWNTLCRPPWETEDLLAKIQNAAEYAQNEQGAWAVGDPREAFGNTETFRLAMAENQKKRSRFHLRDEDEQEQGKATAWLIPELIEEASTVLLVGPTQSYKSFLALDIALAIGTGKPSFGANPVQGITIYAALEGLANIEKKRRRAWRVAHQIEGKIDNFYTMVAPAIGFPGEMEEFGNEIKATLAGRPLKLIVIDTLSKSLAGLNENDSRDAGAFVKFCDSLVENFACSVVAIHHTGKERDRGARGSSAFHAGFDTVLEVRKIDGEAKAVEVWVRKHKDAEERSTPWTFKGRTVGQSLVFEPTTAAEHRSAVDDAEPFSTSRIYRVLSSKSARSRSTALTTTELCVGLNGAEAIGNEAMARTLGKLGKSTLRAYCEADEDGVLWWFLPSTTEEAMNG